MGSERRVRISGVGYVSALSSEEVALDSNGLVQAPEICGFEVPESRPAYGFELHEFELEDYLPGFQTFVDRTSAFALAAAQLALNDAGLERASRSDGEEIGCAYGTTFGCLEAMEIFWKKVKNGKPKFAPPLPFTHSYNNSPSSLLCIQHELKGVAATFAGAYGSGMEALLFAFDQIRSGSAKVILVGASESLTSPLHAHLFAEGLLHSTGLQKPSGLEEADAGMTGVVPGEGGVCLLLEDGESAQARGCKGYGELTDVGLEGSGDATVQRTVLEDQIRLMFSSCGKVRAKQDKQEYLNRQMHGLGNGREIQGVESFSGELFSAMPLLGLALASEAFAKSSAANKSGRSCSLLGLDKALNTRISKVVVGVSSSDSNGSYALLDVDA